MTTPVAQVNSDSRATQEYMDYLLGKKTRNETEDGPSIIVGAGGRIGTMLADFGKRPSQGGRGYNEIVVGEARWHTRLPHSFEAFFYPLTSNCRRRPECEAHTRAVHADFLRDYPGSAVPLLSLDPSNWEAPFAVATDP